MPSHPPDVRTPCLACWPRVFVALVPGLWTAAADDPPKKLTPEERKELEAKWSN